jgi:hypothetical protein
MYKIKQLIILLALSFSAVQLNAQSGNSPYSRFGYGEINTVSYSGSRAMGGIGVGYRTKISINPTNPASYSCVDTLTFKFDLGASGGINMFLSNNQKSNNFDANFDYINLLFPITKWMGFSAGLNTFSSVGYNYSQTTTLEPNTPENPTGNQIISNQSYNGIGGLTQVYAGTAVKLFNHVSLGVNLQYLFGNITHNKRSELTSETEFLSSQTNNLQIRDLNFRGGLQYFTTIKQKHDITIGGIFEPKSSLSGNYQYITTGGGFKDTINTKSGFEFPMIYGAGVFYTYNNKISVGLDYVFQDWNNTQYNNKKGELKSVNKAILGLEYLPDSFGKKYIHRIRYRVGFSVSNSYVNLDDKLNNFAVTAGFGFPFRRDASLLNLGFEYGQKGERNINPGDNLGIRENYFKITLSTTFVERWFQKNVIR